jgi:hypothetical protein
MRALILAAGAALTLAACGGGTDDAAETNMSVETLDAGNIIVNDPAAMNGTATLDANTSANLVAEDLTTNSPDSNLANGL